MHPFFQVVQSDIQVAQKDKTLEVFESTIKQLQVCPICIFLITNLQIG